MGVVAEEPTTRTVTGGPVVGPSVAELVEAYAAGAATPTEVCRRVLAAIEARGADGVWISVATEEALLRRCHELESMGPDRRASLPLFGVPFAVKDSIDVAGWSTTLACPEYASTATATAPVVQRLLDAGAVLVGKTNLDQFATGLNGTRSPYGVPHSVYGGELISGGSSSGSALAVALGEVTFAVATDTAGSGRVPAALNGIAGYKPSRGVISTVGLVPACRSLDCISLMAQDFADIALLMDVVAADDPRDPWHRPRVRAATDLDAVTVGLPERSALDFFGDDAMAAAHGERRSAITRVLGSRTVPLSPFLDAGSLLYNGPWVAERLLEFGDFLDAHPGAAVPVVEQIIRSGDRFSAVDAFRAQYRLADLRSEVAALFDQVDVVVLPTIGTTFTVEQVLIDPVGTNTVLGHYTHCGNLLDLCAAAVPAGLTTDHRPVSCMVLAPALRDDLVITVARRLAEVLSPS